MLWWYEESKSIILIFEFKIIKERESVKEIRSYTGEWRKRLGHCSSEVNMWWTLFSRISALVLATSTRKGGPKSFLPYFSYIHLVLSIYIVGLKFIFFYWNKHNTLVVKLEAYSFEAFWIQSEMGSKFPLIIRLYYFI